MEEKFLRIEGFTDEEQELIEEAIACLQKKRRYSSKPRFYHDLIVDGCQALKTDERA